MNLPNNYDAWRSDNGEKECPCDDCSTKTSELYEVMASNKYICDDCRSNYKHCSNCNEIGTDEAFSYGHDEMCDKCCDKKADMLQDLD